MHLVLKLHSFTHINKISIHCIVDFQNGELKDEEVKSMSCGVFHDQMKDKTVLALSNGQMVYKGYKPNPKKQHEKC